MYRASAQRTLLHNHSTPQRDRRIMFESLALDAKAACRSREFFEEVVSFRAGVNQRVNVVVRVLAGGWATRFAHSSSLDTGDVDDTIHRLSVSTLHCNHVPV